MFWVFLRLPELLGFLWAQPRHMAGPFSVDDFNDSKHPAVRSGVLGFFYNGCLIAALVSFLIAQLAKVRQGMRHEEGGLPDHSCHSCSSIPM